MTVSYSGTFIRILFKWKGSVWKAIWRELVIWLILFYLLAIALQYAIPEPWHNDVKKVIDLFNKHESELPIGMAAFPSRLLS